MKNLAILPLALLAASCLPEASKNQIIVDGEATVEAMPDHFKVSASIYSKESTQEEALGKITAIYAEIKKQLPMLEGIEKLQITTSGASVGPVYEYRCEQESYDEESCPVIGYQGSISVSIEGSPADMAGNVLSYVSELGAASVSFNGFFVSNYSDYQKQAMRAAVENARKKAELIASASGSTILGAAKIQSGNGFNTDLFGLSGDQIVVTAQARNSARFDLDIEPQPISVSAKVAAAFEIE